MRRLPPILAALCLIAEIAVAGSPAVPTPPPREDPPLLSPEDLDHAIETVIARPEYSWRLPRERAEEEEEGSGFWKAFWLHVGDWLRNAIDHVADFFRRIRDWLERHFPDRDYAEDTPDIDWQLSIQIFLFILSAATACLLAIFLYRFWKRRTRSAAVAATPLPRAVDITDNNVEADQLPSDAWMAMAEDLLRKGEVRLAIRAMFLASLASLGHRARITLARHKSNREYLRELRRKAHDDPPIVNAFGQNVDVFERVWYGKHPADGSLLAEFTRNQQRLLSGNSA